MAIFAISDLHLSLNGEKPMDIFGNNWANYEDTMKEKWNKIVSPTDTVIIPGDISWATYITDALKDFQYINSLTGNKLILKGNHDYWWTTKSKMNEFLLSNNLTSISILQNSAYLCEKTAVCGTRGWTIPSPLSTGEDKKIFEREKQRLILSLEDASSKKPENIIVAMHYPPVDLTTDRYDFLEIMKQYNVTECVYGHLHSTAHKSAPIGTFDGIKLRLVSCDYTGFVPVLINR